MIKQTMMVQGTTSDAGKSTLVAGLCRVLKSKGIINAPFKPQNMALNSAVTPDGGEIGRAQALQAQAAGVVPSVHMNPVLMKPSSDRAAQIIVQGQPWQNEDAQSYQRKKETLMPFVLDSFSRLQAEYKTVLIEGAGSPAEINLRARDIANMGFAEAVDCPVILIADIDKGGVFAHIVGTLELLSESEQARICGVVINRFRGDISLLQSGLDWLEKRTGKPVLGVLPYLHDLYLDSEDAVANKQTTVGTLNIVVPILPRMSNHTDFDALRLHPDVNLIQVRIDQPIPPADLVILPGSKNVRSDIEYLKQQGWGNYLDKHLRYGGKLLGICGGYQMLGKTLNDPLGIESTAGNTQGFGLLDMHTEFKPGKHLKQRSGCLVSLTDAQQTDTPVKGYEIHCGETSGPALDHPLWSLIKNNDTQNPEQTSTEFEGIQTPDNQIRGTYLHGLFDQPETLSAMLDWAGLDNESQTLDLNVEREKNLERLAKTLEEHLDIDRILGFMR